MKQTVGCFSDAQLKEIANNPNAIVYTPQYNEHTPLPTIEINSAIDDIVKLTRRHDTQTAVQSACRNIPHLKEFSEKHDILFEKLTTRSFVDDPDNLTVIKRYIALKHAVENNLMTPEKAQAEASSIAINSLTSRVKDVTQQNI